VLRAPWTDDQVASLREYQRAGTSHPYTSMFGKDLIPTIEGWREERNGDVVQDWCYEWTADWSWKTMLSELFKPPK
jgi:hypothetical protein